MFPLLIYLGSFLAVLLVLYRTFRFRKRCPACGYSEPDRMRRKGIMKRLPVKAYCCPACRHRFYLIEICTKAPLGQPDNSISPEA